MSPSPHPRADTRAPLDAVAITLDTDWAPDVCIDAVADTLRAANVRATWFITHDSPAIRRLMAYPALFEIGWHPNFFPGSTQGRTDDDVLAFCTALAPQARSVRMHGLLQSTRLLARLRAETPIRVDVSVLLPGHAHLAPVVMPLPEGELIRLPYWWEDDVAMMSSTPEWTPATAGRDMPGMRILNFHPVHVALEADSLEPYEALKRVVPALPLATAAQLASAARPASVRTGAGVAFRDAVAWLAARGGGATMAQLAGIDSITT